MDGSRILITNISQDTIIDIAFSVISEVNFNLAEYGIEVKCSDFRVEEKNLLVLDIIDSENATLGVSVRINDLSPDALKDKVARLISVISASYGELYLMLNEGRT